jgi:hypothetical protein
MVRKNVLYCSARAAKAQQKYLVLARKAKGTKQEGPLSFVLFKAIFSSVSTVNRDHPSLVVTHNFDELHFNRSKLKKQKNKA